MIILISFRIQHRYSHKIQATILQENEEKVAVEESFQPKSSPENGGRGDNGKQPETSSDGLEKFIIKLEQSINVFLTVCIVSISLQPYSEVPQVL